MSIYITRRPEKTIGSQVSRWTALHNPYLFEFTRKDFPVVNTAVRPAYHATKPTVQVGGDLTGMLTVGELIYLNSGVYNGVYEVLAAYIGSTVSYVVLNTAYISVGGAGYINLPNLVNYKLYVNIYDAVSDDVIETLYIKPDSTGVAMVDVAGVLKSVLETEDTCGFANTNEPNRKISGSFYIGYGFSYKFGDTQITTVEVVDGTTYYWISAAQQITGKTVLGIAGLGQNMGLYVPLNQTGEAKFLTMFEKPTRFAGYPFALSFIYDKDFETTYVARHQHNYNINRVGTSTESSVTLSPIGLNYMNDMQLADEDATTTEMDVWLETAGTITGGGYVEDGYMASGYTG